MLRLVPTHTNFDFIGKRIMFVGLSVFMIMATAVLLALKGLNYGIDFSGGTLVQLQLQQPTEISKMRDALSEAGFSPVIQEYGSPTEVLVRLPAKETEGMNDTIAQQISNAVATVSGSAEVRRVEFVGPQIGEELKEKGLLATVVSLIAILVYVSARFELRFAVGAIAALAHDVIITVGVFSLTQKEISLPVLAAILTIIGYSLNDTIVVFDRIRETMQKYKKLAFAEILNLSVNSMLSRTLMTSLTTLVVLAMLFMFGGEVIHDFAFALLFGVIVGTYSSIFVAAPVVMWLEGKLKINLEDDDDEGFSSIDA